MNFYKHHIGDYAQATAHLSFVEDAAYSRMLRKYYAEEKPLPADLKAVQRLVGARTRDEKEAVDTVLQEFFTLADDGWHNKRADAELARAGAQAEANRKVAEEREARRRARITGERQADECSTIRSGSEHESLRAAEHESLPSREPSQTPDTTSHSVAELPQGGGAKRSPAPTRPDDVAPQVWADWLALRRAKKAPVTPTVVERAQSEAASAGMSLEAFLRVWCARGSQGLLAEWLKPDERRAGMARTANDDIFAGAR